MRYVNLMRTFITLVSFVSLLCAQSVINSDGLLNGAPVPQTVPSGAGVVVELVLLERKPNHLKFQVKIKNTSDVAVLIVSGPVRVDGSKGAYLSLNDSNRSLLEIQFTVFPPPIYTIYAPKDHVTFVRLARGATQIHEVLLEHPLKETKPPWGEWIDQKSLNFADIHQVVAKLGVLPDDPGVHSSLANVPSADGGEMVESGPLKGKALFKIQTIVSSNVIDL